MIAAQVEVERRVASVRSRVDLQDNSRAVAAPCIQRATSQVEGPREQLAPALVLVLALVPVPVSVPRAPEWVVPPAVLYRLQARRRVHSVQVARSVVAASNTRRQKKAR